MLNKILQKKGVIPESDSAPRPIAATEGTSERAPSPALSRSTPVTMPGSKKLAKSAKNKKQQSQDVTIDVKEATPPKLEAPPKAPPKPLKMGKAAAKAIVRRFIEIYWDGEDKYFECEVLSYDEATKKHRVFYPDDGHECEEDLREIPWRGPLPRKRGQVRLSVG